MGRLAWFTLKSAPQLGQKANQLCWRPKVLGESGLQNLHLLKYGANFEVGSSWVRGSLARPFLDPPSR